MEEIVYSREQLEERLAALHEASLELVKEISLEALLERLASLACEQAGRVTGSWCMDEYGNLANLSRLVLPTAEEISHPRASGFDWAYNEFHQPDRIPNIPKTRAASGFPPPPPMHSSLVFHPPGRPFAGSHLLKRNPVEFFYRADQMVIRRSILCAAAIAMPRLYNPLVAHERALSKRTENLALLNDLAVTVTSSSKGTGPLYLDPGDGILNIEVAKYLYARAKLHPLLAQHEARDPVLMGT